MIQEKNRINSIYNNIILNKNSKKKVKQYQDPNQKGVYFK